MNMKKNIGTLFLVIGLMVLTGKSVSSTVLSVEPDIDALSTSAIWRKDWKKFKEVSVIRDEAITSAHRKLLEYSVSLGFDGKQWRPLYRWIGDEARFQGTKFRPYSKSFVGEAAQYFQRLDTTTPEHELIIYEFGRENNNKGNLALKVNKREKFVYVDVFITQSGIYKNVLTLNFEWPLNRQKFQKALVEKVFKPLFTQSAHSFLDTCLDLGEARSAVLRNIPGMDPLYGFVMKKGETLAGIVNSSLVSHIVEMRIDQTALKLQRVIHGSDDELNQYLLTKPSPNTLSDFNILQREPLVLNQLQGDFEKAIITGNPLDIALAVDVVVNFIESFGTIAWEVMPEGMRSEEECMESLYELSKNIHSLNITPSVLEKTTYFMSSLLTSDYSRLASSPHHVLKKVLKVDLMPTIEVYMATIQNMPTFWIEVKEEQ